MNGLAVQETHEFVFIRDTATYHAERELPLTFLAENTRKEFDIQKDN